MTNAFRSSNCKKKKRKKENHITIITTNNNILVTRPSKPNNYSIYFQGVSELTFVLP